MIKKGSIVYSKQRNMFGQIIRIRNNIVTISFVTSERVEKKIDDLEYKNDHWRFND